MEPPSSPSLAADDQAIAAELARITARKHELAARASALDQRAAAFAAKAVAAAKPEPLIYLNVGGTSYHTTTSNLVKIRGSRLEIMFSGRHELKKDDKQDYFIDRDGPLFKHVLNFLRDDAYDEPKDDVERKLLKLEFEYYGIPIDASGAPKPAAGAAAEAKATSIYNLLDRKEAHLTELETQLKEQEDAYVDEVAMVAEANKLTAEKVTINVSGTVLTTARSTLCHVKDTMLTAMFTEGSKHTLVRDREGRIFLDRDADRFRQVLNALRNSREEMTVVSTPALLTELDKLCIARDKLLRLSSRVSFRPGPNYVIANGRGTKTSGQRWDATVLSADPLQSNDAVHIRFMCPSANVMVGVAPASINTASTDTYNNVGAYVYFQSSKTGYLGGSANPGAKIHQPLGPGVPKDAWVRLNTTNRTLEFSFTTPPQQWHVAYNNVDCSQPQHLCALLYNPNAWVEVVE